MAEQKRRGPKKQYESREDVHLKLPKELVEAIDRLTVNRTAWIVEAIQEKLQRETR